MLKQDDLDSHCNTAKMKYARKSRRNASLEFSYECQGYIAALVDTHGWTLDQALDHTVDLLAVLRKANPHLTQDDPQENAG